MFLNPSIISMGHNGYFTQAKVKTTSQEEFDEAELFFECEAIESSLDPLNDQESEEFALMNGENW